MIFVSAKRVISVPSEQVIYFPAENVKEGFALFRLRSINARAVGTLLEVRYYCNSAVRFLRNPNSEIRICLTYSPKLYIIKKKAFAEEL